MKKLLLAAALAVLPLGGCATIPVPGAVADQIVMDEQGRITAGLLYVTASRLGNALCPSGSGCRRDFQQLDAVAYSALERVRAAYAAGNADDYRQAYVELQRAVSGINLLRTQP